MQQAQFHIPYVQLLNEDSQLICDTLPDIIKRREDLVDLYRLMLLTRIFDATAINLQRTGLIGTYAAIKGQEAIGTGIGKALQPNDVFIPYYRDIATQLQRGVRVEELLQYWGGDERGSNYSQQAYDFPLCVPIGTQACHATGIAYALKYQQQSQVALVTCGDGATSKGDFYESLNMAGVMQLPIVFVVNNNQWAISVPRSKQSAAPTLAQKAFAAGFEGIQVDGNDVIAMTSVLDEAIQKARNTNTPTLIEAITYRLSDHTTADDASRYRSADELAEAERREPIARLKKYLQTDQDWTDEEDQQLMTACKAEIEKGIEAYKIVPPQVEGEFFDYMFAELPHDLKLQKEQFLKGIKHHG